MTSSAARSWAEAQAGGFALSPAAADLLEELYTPSLPAAAAEFDREVAALPADHLPTWGLTSRRPGTGADLLLDGLDHDTLRRVLVWSLATMPPYTGPEEAAPARTEEEARRHRRIQRHFSRSALDWDGATLPLLLRTCALGLRPSDLAVNACAKAPRHVLAASADTVRAVAAHLEEWLVSVPAEDRDREQAHHRLLGALLELGEAPASLDGLCYAGDRFFDRLRAARPDLLTAPGLPALLVHSLQPFHGDTWRQGLPDLLTGFTDLDGALRGFLEVALDLPDLPDPVPALTARDRLDHHLPGHVRHRGEKYIAVHAGHLLRGMSELLPLLDPVPRWAPDLLRRLVLHLGVPAAGRGPRALDRAGSFLLTFNRLPGPESLAALVEIRSELRDRTAVGYADATLRAVADRMGLSAAEAAERTVPAHGLGPDGTRTERVGGHSVTVAVTEGGVALRYTGPDGRTGSRAPRELAAEHPEALKEAKDRAARVRRTFKAEQERLGALGGHAPALGVWVSSYLEHPVTGPVARGLAWAVDPDGRPGTPERDGGHWLLRADDGGVLLHTADAPPATRVRRAP